MIHLPLLVVLLTVLLLFVVTLLTGRARRKYNIQAPAVSGHPLYERAYRIQMNTLEHSVILLPALWLAARASPAVAGILGLAWLVGRVWYVPAYMHDPASRGRPFLLSLLALVLMILLAIYAVVRIYLLQPL